jgi:hypothetical protein
LLKCFALRSYPSLLPRGPSRPKNSIISHTCWLERNAQLPTHFSAFLARAAGPNLAGTRRIVRVVVKPSCRRGKPWIQRHTASSKSIQPVSAILSMDASGFRAIMGVVFESSTLSALQRIFLTCLGVIKRSTPHVKVACKLGYDDQHSNVGIGGC